MLDFGQHLQAQVAIVFDLKSWFAGLDFSKATLAADGTMTIDEDTNKDLLQGLVKNLKHTTGFGKDEGGHGKLTAAQMAGKGDAAATENEEEAEGSESASQAKKSSETETSKS